MKGIVVINRRDLDKVPEMEATLLHFSELMERDGENCLFFSREGVLMTMICELLDKEVPYTLKLEGTTDDGPSGRTRSKARVSHQ